MVQSTKKRRKQLINPKLQMQLIGSFAGIALLAMFLQFLTVGYFLSESVSRLENGGEIAAQIPGSLLSGLAVSVLFLGPLVLSLGVMLTFRFAGPVYRFEQHLGAMARGEKVGPCKIREGDQLQSLCDAINLATEPLWQVGEKRSKADDPTSTPELRKAA